MTASHSQRASVGAVLCALALLACGHTPQPAIPDPQRQPRFVAEGSVLFREDSSGRTALLALDSARAPAGVPVAPAQWAPVPGSSFLVAARGFRHVVPAPQADYVAWETAGTHDLLGVLPGGGGNFVVLDFFFDSSAEELLWAPAGRYLYAFYLPPSGSAELRVYDARNGTRLATPWNKECRPESNCEVVSARWTGPAMLAVKTSAREYQTDVSRLK